MKDKIDPKILIVVVLGIILLYCGFRSLSCMAAASGHLIQPSADQNPGTMERLLQDLDRTMVIEADTSQLCASLRDPFVVVEVKKDIAAKVPPPETSAKPATRKKMRLTGLILDQDPVAIVEFEEKSLEVKIGSLLAGYKVVGIDESGVQILKNGAVVIIN